MLIKGYKLPVIRGINLGNLICSLVTIVKTCYEEHRGRWRHRRTLGLPRPVDHLDSTYTSLNNPENCQKSSKTESPEPSTDERPTEEGRKGGKAVRTTRTGGREAGWRGGPLAKQSP